jgi:hypothetical protein
MVEFGPIQLIAIGFPEVENLKGELLKEIFRLSEKKIIRVVGLLAIVKDEKGKIASVQVTELSDDDRIKLGAGIGALGSWPTIYVSREPVFAARAGGLELERNVAG